eukprot:m.180807 g.180807  ORF g.180807 m.180807 type:complete len:694 (-) comp32036_c8_seq1:248-2329(-)
MQSKTMPPSTPIFHTVIMALVVVSLMSSSFCAASALSPHPPPPPTIPQCPPSCPYNPHFRCCGSNTKFPNGTQTCTCPKSVAFSVGFDSDMVLQRAPQSSSVYGQLLGDGVGSSVEVTVTDTKSGSKYTVLAVVAPAPTYCVENYPKMQGVCVANYSASWKAVLKPAPAGGDFTITATCTTGCHTDGGERDMATLKRVTMGDVYFCSGQSNMALESTHSFSTKQLMADILSKGVYSNLRFFQFEYMGGGKVGGGGSFSPMWTRQTGASSYTLRDNNTRPMTWFNVSFAAAVPDPGPDVATNNDYPVDSSYDYDFYNNGGLGEHIPANPLTRFSATCLEFGRSLIDELGNDAPPIGLIQSAIGGTTIEAWSPNTTTLQCQNKTAGAPTAGKPNGVLYYGMVCPFVNTTVAGWVWYQGENNMHGSPGSSLLSEGYGCMMQRMVAEWREIWSAVPNTTHALAPFGIVTIAPSGSEGASEHMSAFRWAQTANYGTLPNPALPNTFLAQTYDLNEPWANVGQQVCSSNSSIRFSCTWNGSSTGPSPCCHCGDPKLASPKCVWDVSLWNKDLAPIAPLIKNSTATPQFMGSIHPRLKRPVGRRLAVALVGLAYGGTKPLTGPTISGCDLNTGNHSLVVKFNTTLLRGDPIAITRTQTAVNGSGIESSLMQVCTGSAEDCGCMSWIDNTNHPKIPPPGWV